MKRAEFEQSIAQLCQLRDEILEEFQSLVAFETADSMHAGLLSRTEVTVKRTELLLKYWEVSNRILELMRKEVASL